MTAAFIAITPDTLASFLDRPALAGEYVLESFDSEDRAHLLDIGSAWHGIHFLLTGEQDGGEAPEASVIFGGDEMGPDLVYGPIRLMSEGEVAEVATFLATRPASTLRTQFDPQALQDAEIYPEDTWVVEGDDAFEFLAQNYEALRAFYIDAAAKGWGMLLAIV